MNLSRLGLGSAVDRTPAWRRVYDALPPSMQAEIDRNAVVLHRGMHKRANGPRFPFSEAQAREVCTALLLWLTRV